MVDFRWGLNKDIIRFTLYKSISDQACHSVDYCLLWVIFGYGGLIVVQPLKVKSNNFKFRNYIATGFIVIRTISICSSFPACGGQYWIFIKGRKILLIILLEKSATAQVSHCSGWCILHLIFVILYVNYVEFQVPFVLLSGPQSSLILHGSCSCMNISTEV